ncbi:MAG: MBL fold metallo-hydrolase [Clostridia bacterium]|nr:MBL fold metallo-hydrolase [Clostridia bacterium]
MKVTTIRTTWAESELQQNTHIITIGDKCIIVDAGASLEDILNVVGYKKVEAILITHAHFDHISNIDAYEIAFGCPIYMNEHSKKFLHDPVLNVSKFFVHEIIFDAENIHYIKGKETLSIAGIDVKAIYTPGHSEDSMCYLCIDNNVADNSEQILDMLNYKQDISQVEQQNVLFTGDTCFAKAVGRTDLATGNPKRLIVSLNHLLKLDFTTAYTGHMRHTTKQEQEQNIPTWIKYIKSQLVLRNEK